MRLFSSCLVGELGDVHTVKSHGGKVMKTHLHDWIILVLLCVIEIILNSIEPFHRFVGEDMMTDLKYPLKENTIPFAAVPVSLTKMPYIFICRNSSLSFVFQFFD